MKGAKRAVIVKRTDEGLTPDTNEIEALAHSAGYTVTEVITQSREEDPEYNIGSGKVPEIDEIITQTNSSTVIFDNALGPYQKYNLGIYFPEEITVLDRYSLILNIFEQRATTKEGQLQVELARLRYELPRAEVKTSLAKRDEKPGFMGLGEYDEEQEKDIKNQISRIKNELNKIEDDNRRHRERRREDGCELVALAGYTNAGKSTLLRRLAENIDVDENEELHPDLTPTAESTERLFTTLDTTTRRMDYEKRDILVTDTVGFIRDLPQWLVDSFGSTLDSIYYADLVLLLVDATEPVSEIHEKMVTCRDAMAGRLEEGARIITVFNKVDAISDKERQQKMEEIKAIEPNCLAISAESGEGIEELKQKIDLSLPPLTERRLQIPLTDESMSTISWIHDNAYVKKKEYTAENVLIEFEAKPSIAEKAVSKVAELSPSQTAD